jgi:hypothetical protein
VIQYSPLCRIDRLSRSQEPHIWREVKREGKGGEREEKGGGGKNEKGVRVGEVVYEEECRIGEQREHHVDPIKR